MTGIWLIAATLALAIPEDARLQAGGMLPVQLELPEDVDAEVRLIDVTRGTIVASKRVNQLSPERMVFALPRWLTHAALELWVDGDAVLRLPEDPAAGFEIEAPLPTCMSEALPCDSSGASLAGADLEGARLSGIDLSRADLRAAHLSDADLTGADLTGAVLSGADFEAADLSNASLVGADLSGAHLYVTDLEGADLRSADLTGAELTNANLANADLLGANLARTRISGVELSGARCPDGHRALRSCKGHRAYE